MKRYICSLAVCVMMLSAHAQNKMNIVKADGQVETYPTTAVNSVEFDNSTVTVKQGAGDKT